MELIKEIDGWKLFKEQNVHKFEILTPEGIKQVNNRISFSIDEFERMVQRGWIWIDVEFFTASILNSKIVTKKEKRSIQSNKYEKFVNTKNFYVFPHYMTEKDANESLKETLKKAKEKFEICKELLNKIQSENDFIVDYTMEGDTHGIYEDYLHITFNIDGTFCKFELND